MKINLLFSLFLFFAYSLNAQQQSPETPGQTFSTFDKDLNWVELRADQTIPANSFFQNHYKIFGLDRPEDMQMARQHQDQLGWNHFRYHQFYQGIRVEGGTYLLHEKNGKVIKANGRLYPDIQVNTAPFYDREKVIQQALRAFPAERYAWDNSVSEQLLQKTQNDPKATHFPQPELVIMDRAYPKSSGQYALAYKLILYREAPVVDRRMLWYDAHSGELLLDINLIHEVNGEEGTAHTRYHGEQKISTIKDETGEYILRDTSRGGGIETYNDNYSEYGELADFTDDDNVWDNANIEQDEVATDVHFGTMATYDFYFENFGRNSYDNLGSPMISMVHVGENFNNAYWDGSVMSYGDGDSILFYPLTTIDVVGHEITHGVTEHSAALIYSDESGALNESFSDIFGKTIEALYTPDDFSWINGERISVDKDNIIRSMSDPHLGDDPKYYKGELWIDGADVHVNSGVQNHWYYLLCEGKQGVNEAGLAYNVPAIGIEKAMRIAYRNLNSYLTESSGYKEARFGSLQATADLYGQCSEEYLAVAEAWAVVGLGSIIQENDYAIDFTSIQETACVVEEIDVEISFLNNSCNTTLSSGSMVTFNYQFDDEDVVTEQLSLSSDLMPTTSTNYVFSKKILNPSIGEHTLKAWIDQDNDPFQPNDTIRYTFENRAYQNEEFAARDGFGLSGVCNPETARRFLNIADYHGCDTLPSATQIPYQSIFKNEVIDNVHELSFKLSPGRTTYFSEEFQLTNYGFGIARTELQYPGDPISENNFSSVFLARLTEIQDGWSERFDPGLIDSTTLAIENKGTNLNRIQLVDTDHRLVITGSNILDEENNLRVNKADDPVDFYFRNANFWTNLSICVNTQNISSPALLFDFQQTKSDVDWTAYDINPDFATMIAVNINGVIDTLIYGANAVDFQTFRLDLSDYQDDNFEISITALALQSSIDSLSNTIKMDGDNVIIDNIRLDLGTATHTPDQLTGQATEVSPNPTTNSFILRRKDQKTFSSLQIQLIDVTGKILLQQSLPETTTAFEFGKNLFPGIYFLKLTDGKNHEFVKVIKQ